MSHLPVPPPSPLGAENPEWFDDFVPAYSCSFGNWLLKRLFVRLFVVFIAALCFTAGPAAWNSLPVHMWNIGSHSAFCQRLKTYLFTVPD